MKLKKRNKIEELVILNIPYSYSYNFEVKRTLFGETRIIIPS